MYSNGFSRGNRFRNQTSNAQAGLLFLFQCAGKPGHEVVPVRGNADLGVREIATGQGIGREEPPVADEDREEGDPLDADRAGAQQEEERVAQADLREGVLERAVGLPMADRAEEDAQEDRAPTPARPRAASSCPVVWPRARRLASENGSATPTRNENDGWIMSWSTQPTHSTCDW